LWFVVQSVLNRVQQNLAASRVVAPTVVAPATQPAHVQLPAQVSNEQAAAHARAQSEAELKEWQRNNAESMKILEKTTPEAR